MNDADDHAATLAAGRSTRLQVAAAEYMLLQKKFDEEGAEACMTEGTELVHVRTAGPEEHARWAERRACWRWGRYPPPGHGDGTQLALQEARGQVLLCKTPGCYSIVDMQAARRRANKDERDFFMDGDGCAGALCSARPWPQRHGRRQAATASKLGAGGKTLLLWPPSTAARRDQWAVPTSLALSVADSIFDPNAGSAAAAPCFTRNRGGGSEDGGTDDEDDEGLGDMELDESASKQG